ncbi:MAG TPA: two-component regulator propeller domain-containing protein, partial [Ohtaekwangia sp.]|uniref:ligand-binding sensor domain-containing protein n=1 Tax=Ohtaekwangia sp. TaxID=2066019 RepID=UPI002F94FF9D
MERDPAKDEEFTLSIHGFMLHLVRKVLVILLCVNAVYGQKNVRLERISVREGLSQADVRCMMQDDFGFLWIGTRDGLNKYDGHEFRKYLKDKNDSTSLHFSQIHDLERDSVGNFWIGASSGISYYDYKTDDFSNYFLNHNQEASTEVNDIFIQNDNTLVLSTNRGLHTFNTEKKSFSTNPVYSRFSDHHITQFHTSEKFGTWVATHQGLYIKHDNSPHWVQFLNEHRVEHINFDNDKVYISTSGGLFRYVLSSRTVSQVPLPVSNQEVMQSLRTRNGELWVASNQVVVLDRDDKTVKYILSHERDNGFSLSEDKAQLLYQTRDHVIWIGTFGYGLNKYNPDVSAFSYLGEQSPLPLSTNYISTIFTHDDSTLFIGTSRGLNLVDMRRGVVNTFFSDKEVNLVYKIKADARGDIWVSTAAGFYNYRDSRFIPMAFNPGPMYDITDWDEQTIALATRMQGIYLFNKATHVPELLIPASQLPDVVFAIQVTKNNLWVAGKDGLRVFTRDGRLQKHFRSRSGEVHGLPVDNV